MKLALNANNNRSFNTRLTRPGQKEIVRVLNMSSFVTCLTGVVGYDPREDWVLHEIVVRSSSQGVQMHEVLKIGNFTTLDKKCCSAR